MIVYVAFEFDGVGPDSPEADDIVELMSNECEHLCDKYGATAVWIDNEQGSDAA
jgi:hypothetical protein